MKLKYRKQKKFNYIGTQYRQGDILEVPDGTRFPENWFETIEEDEVIERDEEVIELPKRKARKPKTKPIEEVTEDGNEQDTNEDLGS